MSQLMLGAFGQGDTTNAGLNSFICNAASVVNHGAAPVSAEMNWWAAAPPEGGLVGPVDRFPFLSAEPLEALGELGLGLTNARSGVEVCWEDIGGCHGYRVYRSGPDLEFAAISGNVSSACFTDGGVGLSSDTYYYRAEIDY